MITPEEEKLIASATQAFFQSLFEPISNFVETISGPFAAEIGAVFGDKAKVYRLKNAVKCMKKAKEILEEVGINPGQVKPRILLPLIENASLDEDEGLQEKWAALLANAANPKHNPPVRADYSDILRQLTPNDVKFVGSIYDRCIDPKFDEDPSHPIITAPLGNTQDLLKIYREVVDPSPLTNWQKMNEDNLTIGSVLTSTFMVSLKTFERLGLLIVEIPYEDVSPARLRPFFHQQFSRQYMLSALGFQFLKACRRPKEVPSR